MRTALLCLALLGMAAAVSGAAQIQQSFYGADDCTGTPISSLTRDTGVCTQVPNSQQWFQEFCANDGNNIYRVVYSDRNCTDANSYSTTQTPTTCGLVANRLKTFCVNPTAGPAPPAFPPAGWSTALTCMNTTSHQQANTCGTGSDIVCLQSASRTGYCYPTGDANTQTGSAQAFCSSDQSRGGLVRYSDNACATVIKASLTPVGCVRGSQFSCAANSDVLPADLPNQGYLVFPDNTGCSNVDAASVVLMKSATCAEFQTFSCAAGNNTQIGTLSTFTSATCAAPASSVVSQTVDFCDTTAKRQFVCEFFPPSPNAAAASSVSFVALLVAAVLAVFAARQ